MRQTTLSDTGFDKYSKKTRKERFLDDMDKIIPWKELTEAIEPFYPKPKGAGRRPIGIERMLCIHFLQHWFNLSDPAAEEALYDSLAMRRFVGIDLGREPAPDECSRHGAFRLAMFQLTTRIFFIRGSSVWIRSRVGREVLPVCFWPLIGPVCDCTDFIIGGIRTEAERSPSYRVSDHHGQDSVRVLFKDRKHTKNRLPLVPEGSRGLFDLGRRSITELKLG